jgi:hypothetical protein
MAEAQAGALQIVQSQQSLVGRTVVGGASAVTGQSSDKSQVGILEQIRDITLKSFRATTKVAETLANTLNFQKNKDAREKDQAIELSKENIKPKTLSRDDVGGDGVKKAEESAGQFNGTMFALGALTTKLLKPFRGLLTFFKKIIPLSGIFARLGPLASGLLRLSGIGTILFILFKYSDEIIKALTPAIESIQKAFVSLKPAIDFIFSIIDGGIKIAINAIGGAISGIALAIEVVADLFSGVLDGLGQLADGNIIDGLKTILKSIVMAPVNLLKGIGNIIGNFILGLIDALPLPKFLKDKFKGAVEKKETTTGSAGDMAGEASVTVGNTMDTSKKPIQTSQALDDEYVDETPTLPKIEKPKEPLKTINVDQVTSATQVADVATKGKSESYTEEQKKKDLEAIDQVTKGGYGKRYSGVLKDLQAQGAVIPQTRGQAQQVGIGPKEYEEYFAEKMKQNVAAGVDPEEVRSFMIMQERMSKLNMARSDIQFGATERPEIMKNNTGIDSNIVPQVKTPSSALGEVISQGTTTVINNQPTSVNTSTNVAKTSVSSSPINVSSGDSYFDRQAS